MCLVQGVPSTEQQLEQLRRRVEQQDAELAQREQEIQELRGEVARLTALVEKLQEALGQNSSNSHKPPSSDSPSDRNRRKRRAKKERKRGGRKGHKGHQRKLLPESEVDELVEHFPPECENCWRPLPKIPDADAKRHQVTEIPPIKPHTTEHRRHQVTCECCGHRTRGKHPAEVSDSPFGPRLSSIAALLTGVYHLSRRRAQKLLRDLLGVKISLGGLSGVEARVSDALGPAVEEAWAQAGRAKVRHTDGTGWKQSGMPMQLWTIATTAVTVFKIIVDGSKETLRSLFAELRGILVSDRAKALGFWAMKRRQICWAHLLRKFVSFSERDGPAGQLGRQLVEYTGILFEYWRARQSGHLSPAAFQHRMKPLQQQVEALLERAVAADIRGVSGACADILAHRPAMWTFVNRRDVEPTNNHAERELRSFVLWRKRSFGTQSARGNAFAENIMTVVHTARKQKREVLALLTDYCRVASTGAAPPMLLTA